MTLEETADTIKKIFDSYFELSKEVWYSFAEHGEIIETAKNEILKNYGDYEKYFNIILRGSGGIMLYNNNNYICTDLCYEGDFLVDYLSILSNVPTPLEIVCFEKCLIFRITKENFIKLSNTDFGKIICQIAAESLYKHKQNQQIEILSKTAEQRFIALFNNHRHILQRTPDKYIASYLGITPESLSRIRKKII